MKIKKIQLEPPESDDKLIWDVWASRYYYPTLTVADQLGVFPFLDKTPSTVTEISVGLNLDKRGTEAMLGVLTAIGILKRERARYFLPISVRQYLLPNEPYYWGGVFSRNQNYPLHIGLLKSFGKVTQQIQQKIRMVDQWDSKTIDAEFARAITRTMHSHSFAAAVSIARNSDFSKIHKLLDVGGGSGCFSIALAISYPRLSCTILELPAVCKVTQEYIHHYKLEGQINTIGCDMFNNEWPDGYDSVFFGSIFHNWGSDHHKLLTKKSFEMLPQGGRIFLHEMLIDESKDSPTAAAAFSMGMFIHTNGKQFSRHEIHSLLESHGFIDVQIAPSLGYYSLICALKP